MSNERIGSTTPSPATLALAAIGGAAVGGGAGVVATRTGRDFVSGQVQLRRWHEGAEGLLRPGYNKFSAEVSRLAPRVARNAAIGALLGASVLTGMSLAITQPRAGT